jgi:hypothetical protein
MLGEVLVESARGRLGLPTMHLALPVASRPPVPDHILVQWLPDDTCVFFFPKGMLPLMRAAHPPPLASYAQAYLCEAEWTCPAGYACPQASFSMVCSTFRENRTTLTHPRLCMGVCSSSTAVGRGWGFSLPSVSALYCSVVG